MQLERARAAPPARENARLPAETDSTELARRVGVWSSGAAAIVLALSIVAFVLLGPWIGMAAYAADPNSLKIAI